jgi:hypothetical protein
MPGGTPYVRSESELEQFLEKCRRYFAFFMTELGGVSMTPLGIRDALGNASSALAS